MRGSQAQKNTAEAEASRTNTAAELASLQKEVVTARHAARVSDAAAASAAADAEQQRANRRAGEAAARTEAEARAAALVLMQQKLQDSETTIRSTAEDLAASDDRNLQFLQQADEGGSQSNHCFKLQFLKQADKGGT